MRQSSAPTADEVFDTIDADNNGVIDRKEFEDFVASQGAQGSPDDPQVMQLVAQRLGTLEASMVRFIEEGEAENKHLRQMINTERRQREATEKRLMAKIDELSKERESGSSGAASKMTREVLKEVARLKDHQDHLSKQVTSMNRSQKQGRQNESSIQQLESRLDQEAQKVAVLENKLQCTVEALHLLNTESEEQKNDESTASELVRLEAWIAEEAMQRRRLQEKLSSGGINVDSPGPGAVRLGCSLGSRGSPAVSEVSDDAWAGLESTVRQIEGQGSGAPKADRSSKRHPADSRLNLIEQAVRELTEQVGDVMTQQAQHTAEPSGRALSGSQSSELIKRIEKVERKQQSFRSTDHINAEFERVREAIETVNRVLTLRLEKVDRQLATVKRKNEAPSEQHREQHQRVVSQVQQHQKQLTDIKAKVEILTQAVSTQKDAPAQRPHKDKGEDGKPKLNDRVTYLESQCDGLEVALRECLEDVSNMVNKSDSNTKMMEQNQSVAESESKLLSTVTSQVELLHAEVESLKQREEEKANGMLSMVDQLERKVEALDELPVQLAARVDDALSQKLSEKPAMNQSIPHSGPQHSALTSEVHQLKQDAAEDRSKLCKIEASMLELGDRVACVELSQGDPQSTPQKAQSQEHPTPLHCYENPARASLHSEQLAGQPSEVLSPPSPPVRSKSSHPPQVSSSRGGYYYHDHDAQPQLVVELQPEHRGSAGGARRRSSSRRGSHRNFSVREEDAENIDPTEDWIEEQSPSPKGHHTRSRRTHRSSRRADHSPHPSSPTPTPFSPPMHETKESLREQLSDMMSGISNLSDKFKGIDPIQRNAQATLLASQNQQLPTPAETSASEVFDAIDVNQDGVIDHSEFRKAYSQANSIMSLGTSLGPLSNSHENMLNSSRISQASGTPPLPARPTKTTNEYLELRKKLLNSRTD